MQIWILTICPKYFESFCASHLIQRGKEKGDLQVQVVDLRDYVDGCFRKVDDSPYGGGAGLILRVEPVAYALREIKKGAKGSVRSVALTPGGKTYRQREARRLREYDHLVLVCGHFEGMDERICSLVDEEISIGDYILSGGELAAMVVTDSLCRLSGKTLKPESLLEESFNEGRLEYPQYTRPADFEGMRVPEVLLSGNHGRIDEYHKKMSLIKTMERRPDFLQEVPLRPFERELLQQVEIDSRLESLIEEEDG